MIKVEELQMRDLVFAEGYAEERTCIKVSALRKHPHDYNIGYITEHGEVWAKESQVEPIPLTEEILEKNGFKQVGDGIPYNDLPEGIWQNDNALCGLDYNDGCMFYTFSNNPDEDDLLNKIYGILYVHELQRALRLCGLTELANNFKV